MTRNPTLDKCKYSGYGIGFDASGTASLPDCSGFGKNIIILGAGMSSSAQIDNRKRDDLIFGKSPTHRLDNATLTAEKKYAIDVSEQQKKNVHFNGVNSHLLVNVLKYTNSNQNQLIMA